MADRDALIVICWLGILILMFFECFYRKLKSKFNRDVEPPRFSSSATSVSSTDRETCGEVLSTELSHHYRRNNQQHDRNNNSGGGGVTYTGPIPITFSSKEMCRISMELGHEEDEEPPPTYEEALSYAKLINKFQFTPYGDSRIVECEVRDSPTVSDDIDSASVASRGGGSSSVRNLNDNQSSDSHSRAKCALTATFPPNLDENANSEEEDESDQSSDSLTDIESSDTETLINRRYDLTPRQTNDMDVSHRANSNSNATQPSTCPISKNSDLLGRNRRESIDLQVDSPTSSVRLIGSNREPTNNIV